jgi:hypothetical protein
MRMGKYQPQLQPYTSPAVAPRYAHAVQTAFISSVQRDFGDVREAAARAAEAYGLGVPTRIGWPRCSAKRRLHASDLVAVRLELADHAARRHHRRALGPAPRLRSHTGNKPQYGRHEPPLVARHEDLGGEQLSSPLLTSVERRFRDAQAIVGI